MGNSASLKLRKSSFDQIVPFWPKKQIFSPKEFSNKTLIESVKALEKAGLPSNEYLVVYSSKEYKALYFSENVYDILGYTGAELVNLKTFAFFNLASISHLKLIYHLKKFTKAFKKLNKEKGFRPDYIRNNLAGIRLKTKGGIEKTFMMINQFQVNQDFELHDTNICSFIDISHLYSGKEYWGIYKAFSDSGSLMKVYSNNGKAMDRFISTNGKAILKLKYEGFSNEKIQELLNMKKVSFEKYRKSMLSITGAKDLSALIQILKYCNIIH